MRRRALLTLCLLALGPAPVSARPRRVQGDDAPPPTAEEDPGQQLEVIVQGVSGNRVELDVGLAEGLEIGQAVLLVPAGAPPVQAVVRRVSLHTSEAEVLGSLEGIEQGVRGTVSVPTREDGEHPGWKVPIEEWDADAPLLAPPRGRLPEEREREIDGRLWFSYDYTRTDDEQPDFAFGRVGLRSDVRNPFGRGGELELDVRFDARTTDAEADPLPGDGEDLRVQRLSWSVGGTREKATRWEVGRFLSEEFPEFGVLDGVEWSRRLGDDGILGASAGFLPRESADFSTGQDTQLAAWYRHLFDPDGDLSAAAGYQRTWFEGTPDRDLVVTKLDWAPAPAWRVNAGAWFDVYGSDETVKDSGPELTRLQSTLSWVEPAGHGMVLSASRVAWPDLARDEISPALAADVLDGQVDRLDWSGWKELGEHWRLSGRADAWRDEVTSGAGGEVRVALRDWVMDQGDLYLAAYSNQGRFSDVVGVRVGVNRWTPRGSWFVDLDLGLASQDDFFGAQEELDLVLVRVGWDRDLTPDWNLRLSADQRLGDQQEATSLGFTLTRTF